MGASANLWTDTKEDTYQYSDERSQDTGYRELLETWDTLFFATATGKLQLTVPKDGQPVAARFTRVRFLNSPRNMDAERLNRSRILRL